MDQRLIFILLEADSAFLKIIIIYNKNKYTLFSLLKSTSLPLLIILHCSVTTNVRKLGWQLSFHFHLKFAPGKPIDVFSFLLCLLHDLWNSFQTRRNIYLPVPWDFSLRSGENVEDTFLSKERMGNTVYEVESQEDKTI